MKTDLTHNSIVEDTFCVECPKCGAGVEIEPYILFGWKRVGHCDNCKLKYTVTYKDGRSEYVEWDGVEE